MCVCVCVCEGEWMNLTSRAGDLQSEAILGLDLEGMGLLHGPY